MPWKLHKPWIMMLPEFLCRDQRAALHQSPCGAAALRGSRLSAHYPGVWLRSRAPRWPRRLVVRSAAARWRVLTQYQQLVVPAPLPNFNECGSSSSSSTTATSRGPFAWGLELSLAPLQQVAAGCRAAVGQHGRAFFAARGTPAVRTLPSRRAGPRREPYVASRLPSGFCGFAHQCPHLLCLI